ncbi:PQQ-binding-like beta-propeller repeat protein [Streptomyces sp. NPDC007251]|uniref:PQQ-binding-like beta-propeller repeat protein n=1 Tax=Streptomyces sp. NPDC007251 TaxID=3154483 RepID=UPI0033C33C1B
MPERQIFVSAGGLSAFNRRGRQCWAVAKQLGSVVSFTAPAAVGRTVYVGSVTGSLFAYDTTGHQAWHLIADSTLCYRTVATSDFVCVFSQSTIAVATYTV